MRTVIELNGYAEGEGDRLAFRPIPDAIRVRTLPTTVVLRAIWRSEPGDNELPGYLPIARMLLDHTEPDDQAQLGQMPELFREPLERWDSASIIFAAYTLRVHCVGEHRLAFPKAELPEMTVRILLDGAST